MLQLQIIGNLGADAQIKNINGKDYLSFRVASTKNNVTTWVSVLHYANANLQPYLVKGQQVFVMGDAKITAYTAQSGAAGVDVSVLANTLQLVGKKEETKPQDETPW